MNTQVNVGIKQMFFVQGAMANSRINVRVGVASGAGTGLLFEIFDPTLGTNYCTNTVVTAGGIPGHRQTTTRITGFTLSCKKRAGVLRLRTPAPVRQTERTP